MIFTTNHKKMEEFRGCCRNIRIICEAVERNADDEELVDEALFYLYSLLDEANKNLSSISGKWASKNSEFNGYQTNYNDIHEKLLRALNMVRHRIVMAEKRPNEIKSYKTPSQLKEKFKLVREKASELDKSMKDKSQYLTEKGKKIHLVKKSYIFSMFSDSDKKMDDIVNGFARNHKSVKVNENPKRVFGSDSKEDRVAESFVGNGEPTQE